MQDKIRIVKTDDGSFTCYNKNFKEKYHSQCGAIREANEKYILPLEIQNGMRILDFCFGLGYNSFLATEKYSNLEIIGLESDIEILKRIGDIAGKEKQIKSFKNFASIYKKRRITDDKMNSIEVVLGDALKKIKDLPENYFDRVFFDPFSINKQPEMWTEKLLADIYRVLKKKGKLATYSNSKRFRKNLIKVGFIVKNGPCVGRKSPSTIAIKT